MLSTTSIDIQNPEELLDYGSRILSFDNTKEGLQNLWNYRAELLKKNSRALIDYLFNNPRLSEEKKSVVLEKLALLKNSPNAPSFNTGEKPIILLSDIDNTYIPHTVKRSRDSLHDAREQTYPGIKALYQALLNGPQESNHDTPTRQGSELVFLTARPGNPVNTGNPGYISDTAQKMTTELLDSAGTAASEHLILYGTATDFVPSLRESNIYHKIRNRKLKNFELMAQIYTGYKFIFFGDNGEADLEVAQALYNKYQSTDTLAALFIHDVKETKLNDRQISDYMNQGIFIYNSVIKATTIAAQQGLITAYQALETALTTLEETKPRHALESSSVHIYNLRLEEAISDIENMQRTLTNKDSLINSPSLLNPFVKFAKQKKMLTPNKNQKPGPDSTKLDLSPRKLHFI